MFISNVLAALEKAEVQYAIAGGYAVAMHGAVRGTVDVDIVVLIEKENLINTEKALSSIGLRSRIPVNANEIFAFREKYIAERELTAWSFSNPNNPLEVVDVLIRYDLKDFNVVNKDTVFGKVQIVSIEDLISMKRLAARPQDLADIQALEMIIKIYE